MNRSIGACVLLALTAGDAGAESAQTAAAKPAVRRAADNPLGDLDAFVARTQKDWKVPGVAIAVVRDGRVVLAKGYGRRDTAKGLPVTPKTLFAIGSATKSFTAAGLGALVAQGKLDWDKPVRDYLPELRLHEDTATSRLTPRDLVTHRSGLPRHDAVWYNAPFTRAELVARLRYLEPSRDLRAAWQYNNLMFVTAGYLTEKLSGTSWEESVRRLVFEPLGMASSNFSVADSQKAPDFALPYEKDDNEEVKQVPFRNIDAVGPAGSINSSVEDMIRYVSMHLGRGRFGDRQVLAESDVRQMQAPQMAMPTPLTFPEVGYSSYGLGLFVTSYRGHVLVHHGGAIDGFAALVTFMPQDNLGMVILTNLGGTPYPTVLSYAVYDRLLGLAPVDWNQRLLERAKASKASEDEAKAKGYTPRKEGTRPAHAVDAYLGEYEHPGYGVVAIERGGEDLRLRFNGMSSPLRHFHYEVFEVPRDALDPLERTKVMFHTGWNGEIESLTIPMEPSVKDIVFARRGEARMSDRGFLLTLAGDYQVGPNTASIAIRGEATLTLSLPGQPVYELVPVRGLTFDVKTLSGYQVEFKTDAGGKIAEIVFIQPSGTFVGKRK